MKNLFYFLPIIVMFFASCKTFVPFTTTIQNKYQISKPEMKQLQFYVSENVIMTKELTGNSNEMVAGKLKTINNKRVDEVVIKQHTAGLMIDTNSKGNLKLSFSNSDDRTLTFGNTPNDERFVLLAESWSGKIGTVNYGGQKYQLGGFSYDASLLVNLKDIRNVKKRKTVEKGRKL